MILVTPFYRKPWAIQHPVVIEGLRGYQNLDPREYDKDAVIPRGMVNYDGCRN